MTKQLFIAEVKTESPYDFKSEKSWEELFEIANEYGDWLSIHTDYRWGGSFDLIKRARQKTDKPLLAKGVHETDEEVTAAIENGADYVLVVGRLPGVYVEQSLIEPRDQYDVLDYPDGTKIVWNQRNLTDGSLKPVEFDSIRQLWPEPGWLAQASFINLPEDIHRCADAFIVGEKLPEFVAHYSKQ